MEEATLLADKIKTLEKSLEGMDKTEAISFIGTDHFFETACFNGVLQRSRLFPEIVTPMVELAKKLIAEKIEELKEELKAL